MLYCTLYKLQHWGIVCCLYCICLGCFGPLGDHHRDFVVGYGRCWIMAFMSCLACRTTLSTNYDGASSRSVLCASASVVHVSQLLSCSTHWSIHNSLMVSFPTSPLDFSPSPLAFSCRCSLFPFADPSGTLPPSPRSPCALFFFCVPPPFPPVSPRWLTFFSCPDQSRILSRSATCAFAARSPVVLHIRPHAHTHIFKRHRLLCHSTSRRVQTKAH